MKGYEACEYEACEYEACEYEACEYEACEYEACDKFCQVVLLTTSIFVYTVSMHTTSILVIDRGLGKD
jgi:hypothetical protein